MKTAKIVVALGLVVLLGTFGIDNIGGDTWVSASAPLPPGWMRNPHPFIPRSHEPSFFLPALILIMLALVTIFDAIVNSPPPPVQQDDSAESGSATTP